MADQLDYYVNQYARDMARGIRVLFVFRQQREGKAEFVNFNLLLGKDIYSAVVIENPGENIPIEFPPPCIVWLNVDPKTKQYRITEATCLDEKAKEENEIVIKKLENFQSMLDVPFTEGETRRRWIPSISKPSKRG